MGWSLAACSGKQTSQATTNNNDKNKNEIHAKKKMFYLSLMLTIGELSL